MHDPSTSSYWKVPLHIHLLVGLNVHADLSGPHRDVILQPILALRPDFQQEVDQFLADCAVVEDELGGRDAILARGRALLRIRIQKAEDAGPWLEYVEAAAKDLLQEDDETLQLVGAQLVELLRPFDRPFLLKDVITVMPGVKAVLKEHASILIGKGFTQDRIDQGEDLSRVATVAAGAAANDQTGHEILTAALQDRVDRMRTFYQLYARRRATAEADLRRKDPDAKLPGFDHSPVEHWRATRPSEVAHRAEAKAAEAKATDVKAADAQATAPKPPTGDVVGDAMAAFLSKSTPATT